MSFFERPLKERLIPYLRSLKPNRNNLWDFFTTFTLAYTVTGILVYLRDRPSPFPYWSMDPPYDEKLAKVRYKDGYDGVYWPLPNDSEEFYQFLLERENDIFEYEPPLEPPYPEPYQSRFQAYRKKHAADVQEQMRKEMAQKLVSLGHFRNLEDASEFFKHPFS
ncbi:hypothetical protein GpartN1_g3558.t1 [Galdieria partita]|uniref:Uncharacterized protein n=1 Tax=Galdieria partita TaxID=83374 RepID=A0A9C7UQR8_9RHOD|nr:hypothetical protein GpartN1_g3558.t1 [Galdieria partita]